MLNRSELLKMKNQLGYNLGQVEKDYIQHIFLFHLYRIIQQELVFKGGTCLQKVYGLGRFSEDLDFTMNGPLEIENTLLKASAGLSRFGYPTKITTLSEDKLGINSKIKVQGPLYVGTELSLCTLRVEISKREMICTEPTMKMVSPIYDDLPIYSLLSMSLEETLAEKVRTILTRNKARDVYDLYHLIMKNVDININMIGKKLEYYDMAFDLNTFANAVSNSEGIWKSEMTLLVNDLPDFHEVEEVIIKAVKKESDGNF